MFIKLDLHEIESLVSLWSECTEPDARTETENRTFNRLQLMLKAYKQDQTEIRPSHFDIENCTKLFDELIPLDTRNEQEQSIYNKLQLIREAQKQAFDFNKTTVDPNSGRKVRSLISNE